MSSKPNKRRSNGSARDKLRRRVADEGMPCHLCGKAIDYSLPAGHPMSYELDEIVPVSKGGDPLDRSNVAPAHRTCNQRRGNRDLGAVGHVGPAADRVGLPLSQEW